MYVHDKDIHSTVTQQYQPPSDTCTRARPSRGVVQGAGSRMGRVWKLGLCSCMVQAMLEAVYAVWVCFWLQYALKCKVNIVS